MKRFLVLLRLMWLSYGVHLSAAFRRCERPIYRSNAVCMVCVCVTFSVEKEKKDQKQEKEKEKKCQNKRK